MRNQQGSILILTLISVVILSLMVMGLLIVGQTETTTTQNYQLERIAYYTAMQGAEEVRNRVRQASESNEDVYSIQATLADTEVEEKHGLTRAYTTGNLKDLEDIENGTLTETPTVSHFQGFAPPIASAVDLKLTSKGQLSYFIYKLHITSKVTWDQRTAYSEVIAGVLDWKSTEGGSD